MESEEEEEEQTVYHEGSETKTTEKDDVSGYTRVIHEGWLKKRARISTFWRERYFILVQGYLHYYSHSSVGFDSFKS